MGVSMPGPSPKGLTRRKAVHQLRQGRRHRQFDKPTQSPQMTLARVVSAHAMAGVNHADYSRSFLAPDQNDIEAL